MWNPEFLSNHGKWKYLSVFEDFLVSASSGEDLIHELCMEPLSSVADNNSSVYH